MVDSRRLWTTFLTASAWLPSIVTIWELVTFTTMPMWQYEKTTRSPGSGVDEGLK
jgi:hypothetical protein